MGFLLKEISLLFIFFSFSAVYCQQIYVSPSVLCSPSCNGDLLSPYSNIWTALAANQTTGNSEIILMKNASHPHFLLGPTQNWITTSGQFYSMIIPQDVTIRPLFCDDSVVISDPGLLSRCFMHNERVLIYVKTQMMRITFQGNLNLYNLQFDGSEDIMKFNSNPQSSDVQTCLYADILCCKSLSGGINLSVNCQSNDTALDAQGSSEALFIMKSTQLNIPNLLLQNVTITQFYFKYTSGFIKPDSVSNIFLNNLQSSFNLFPMGILSTTTSITKNLNLKVDNLDFTSYNPQNLGLPSSQGSLVSLTGTGVSSIRVEFSNSNIYNLQLNQGLVYIPNAPVTFQVNNTKFSSLNLDCSSSCNFIWLGPSSNISIISTTFTNISLINNFALIYTPRNALYSIINTQISQISLGNTKASTFFSVGVSSRITINSTYLFNSTLIQGNMFSIDSGSIVSFFDLKFYQIQFADSSLNKLLIFINDDSTVTGNKLNLTSVDATGSSSVLSIGTKLQVEISNIILDRLTLKSSASTINFFQLSPLSVIRLNGISITNLVAGSPGLNKIALFNLYPGAKLSINNIDFLNFIINGANLNMIYAQQGSLLEVNSVSWLYGTQVGTSSGNVYSILAEPNTIFNYTNVVIDNVYVKSAGHVYFKGKAGNLNVFKMTSVSVELNGVIFFLVYGKIDMVDMYLWNISKSKEADNYFNTVLFKLQTIPTKSELKNIIISDCSQFQDGQIIQVHESKDIFITNFTVLNNNPMTFVALYFRFSNFEIHTLLFKNNTIYSSSDYDWGLIDNFRLINNTFKAGVFNNIYSNINYTNGLIKDNFFDANTLFTITIFGYFENITIENNVLKGMEGFFQVTQSTMIMKNIYFRNLTLDETSTLLYVPNIGNIIITGVLFESTNRQSANQTLSTKSYLISIKYGKASIRDGKFIRVDNPLVAINSNIDLENIQFSDLLSLSNYKRIFSCYLSTVHVSNFKYDGTLDVSDTDMTIHTQFESFTSSLYFTNIELRNIHVIQGKIFRFDNCDTFIANSYFQNIIYQDILKPIFTLSSGDNFQIQNSVFIDLGLICISSNVNQFGVKNSLFSYKNSVVSLADISGVGAVEFSNTKIIFLNPEASKFVVRISEVSENLNLNNLSLVNANTTGGAFQILKLFAGCKIMINGSLFDSNSVQEGNGGALNIEIAVFASLSFTKNLFINNSASTTTSFNGKGGAIFLRTANITNLIPVFNFKDNRFIKNKASLFGGAVYIYNIPPTFDSTNYFEGNIALNVSNDVGSHAVVLDKIKAAKNNTSKQYIPYIPLVPTILFIDVYSGRTFTDQANIALLDSYGQVVLDDSNSIMEIDENSKVKVSMNLFRAKNGVISLNGIVFQSLPGLNQTLNGSTNGIQVFLNINSSQNSNHLRFDLALSNCGMGQILINNTCYDCPIGTFQLSLRQNFQGDCEVCKVGMLCYGGDSVFAQPGYFRFNKTANLFLKCPIEFACLGGVSDDGTTTFENRCAFGYEGNLCSNCIEGFGMTRDAQSCYNCLENGNVYVLIIFIGILMFVVLIIGIRALIRLAEAKNQQHQQEQEQQLHKSKTEQLVLFRILINFIETFTLMKIIPIEWPGSVKASLESTQTVALISSDVLSLDCFFSKLKSYSDLEIIYARLIVYNLVPWALISFGMIFWIIYFKMKKMPMMNNHKFRVRIKITTFIICYLFHPGIVNEDFGFFSCLNLYRDDTPEYYLQRNYDIKCWEGDHLKFTLGLALPSLLLWGVFLPIFVIKKLRDRYIHCKAKEDQYSFFSEGYIKSKYYWEIIIILRKYAVIIAITMSAYNSNSMQLFFTIYFFWIFMLIQLKYTPYIIPSFNFMEMFSIITCWVISTSAIVFRAFSSYDAVYVVLIVITLGTVISFALCWIREYIRHGDYTKIKAFIKKVIQKCRKKKLEHDY